jgi:hypothetical protein
VEVWGKCSLPDTLTRRLPPPAPPLAADFDFGMRSCVRKEVVEEGGKKRVRFLADVMKGRGTADDL